MYLMRRGSWSAPLHSHRGFTLTELLVTVVLLGFVGVGLTGVLFRQQRFYTDLSDIVETRQRIRYAGGLLPVDLRSVSPVGGDIYAMTDTSIAFRAWLGSSVMCTIDPSRTTLTIPSANLAARNGLTAYHVLPAAGDSAFIYDVDSALTSTSDQWRAYRITTELSVAGGCPTGTGLTKTAADSAAGLRFVVGSALPATVLVGSPIWFYRPARYLLYESGGKWYLGYCTGATDCAPQPVSGPYLGGTSGLRFAYFDSTGAVTSVRTQVARIQVALGAQTRQRMNTPGLPRGEYMRRWDSVSVALRNRK